MAVELALHGCTSPPPSSSPAPPSRPVSPVVDAHCHIFNGRDIPVYGFLHNVAIQNEFLQAIATPLVELIAAEVEGNAKTYMEERAVLESMDIARIASDRQSKEAEGAADFVGNALVRFVDQRTSFGRASAADPQTDENDRFIILLYRLFGQSEEFKSKSDLAPYVVANTRRLAEAIVQQQGLSLFADYVRQFCLWAFELTRFRFEIADELAGLFGDPGATTKILVPAIIDMEHWMAVHPNDITPTPIIDQTELMRLIALKQPAGRMVHGFVPFDPWRYLDDLHHRRPKNALDIVKDALEKKGMIGVKLYPAVGFMPIGNARSLSDSDFPPGLQALGPGVGAKIDSALTLLYQYCDANHVPIMAHCANSNGVAPGYALRAAPQFWGPVLYRYHNIRLNLGHFGGIWDFYCPGSSLKERCRPIEQWTYSIGQMMLSYPNLYADVSDFIPVLARTQEERDQTASIFANLQDLANSEQAPLSSRVMYGSDWVALDVEPYNERYYPNLREDYARAFGATISAKFLGQNALDFLGLNVGQATRQRLTRFYRENNREPPDFDNAAG